MSALSRNRSISMSRQSLRAWALLFVFIGTIGCSVVQNRVYASNPDNFAIHTAAVILQCILFCAIPLFVFMMVDGYGHSTNTMFYGLRIAGVALLSEIPYNLAMSGSWIDLSSRNPVFAMVLGFVLMYIYERLPGKSMKNILLKAVVFFLLVVWVDMLRIMDGLVIIVLTGVLWAMKKKRPLQVYVGCAALFMCSILNLYYLAAPLVFLMIHFYNDEQGEDNRWVNYLAYPVILLAVGLIGKYAI